MSIGDVVWSKHKYMYYLYIGTSEITYFSVIPLQMNKTNLIWTNRMRHDEDVNDEDVNTVSPLCLWSQKKSYESCLKLRISSYIIKVSQLIIFQLLMSIRRGKMIPMFRKHGHSLPFGTKFTNLGR